MALMFIHHRNIAACSPIPDSTTEIKDAKLRLSCQLEGEVRKLFSERKFALKELPL